MEKLGQKWEGPYILMRRKNTCAIFMYIFLSMDIFRIIDSTTSSSEDVVLLFITSISNIERSMICSIYCINTTIGGHHVQEKTTLWVHP